MLDTFLVPANTTVTAKGDGAAVDVSAVSNSTLLATLEITKIVEQESLDVSIYGSADGTTWTSKPLAAFAQQFYRGQIPLLLDLAPHPDTHYVRAHWEVARWGRGSETPMFEFQVTLKQIPPEVLREATAEAHTRV
jgi:hypothetical protein